MNLRLLRPKRSALAKLSYGPSTPALCADASVDKRDARSPVHDVEAQKRTPSPSIPPMLLVVRVSVTTTRVPSVSLLAYFGRARPKTSGSSRPSCQQRSMVT